MLWVLQAAVAPDALATAGLKLAASWVSVVSMKGVSHRLGLVCSTAFVAKPVPLPYQGWPYCPQSSCSCGALFLNPTVHG